MQQTNPDTPIIHFVQPDGTIISGSTTTGSLMELAVELGVTGIEGQCGGYVACGTCQVHVPPEWIERVGYATPDEITMLEYEPSFSSFSRLSCQIQVHPELDGLTLIIPGGTHA